MMNVFGFLIGVASPDHAITCRAVDLTSAWIRKPLHLEASFPRVARFYDILMSSVRDQNRSTGVVATATECCAIPNLLRNFNRVLAVMFYLVFMILLVYKRVQRVPDLD